MANLATSGGALRSPKRTFRPRVRLDTSQVRDLRRSPPTPSPMNLGGTRVREAQMTSNTSASPKGRHLPRANQGRRIGRNLTPGTPRRVGRRPLERADAAPAPRKIGQRLLRKGPYDYSRDLQKGGQLASVVRAMTSQVPGMGAPVPIPLPARIALAGASYLLGEGILPQSPRKRLIRRSLSKR